MCKIQVSVPLFGDSFFMKLMYISKKSQIMVSVPLFGDSFFIYRDGCWYLKREEDSFRPLIRGFFFYCRRK